MFFVVNHLNTVDCNCMLLSLANCRLHQNFVAIAKIVISAQVNEVNGGDNVFVRCVSVCVCVCVRSSRSWELNANSSKTVKATDFKFDTRFQGQSGHDRQTFSQKEAWPRSRDHLNFWALNANSSKTVKAADFKFDTLVPRDSPDMTPKNFPKRGRGQGQVTPKFLGAKC